MSVPRVEQGPLRHRTMLDNGYWGRVKPLAAHDLVAEGSSIKIQGVLGFFHDKSFLRVTSGHHTAEPHTSDFRQWIGSLEWRIQSYAVTTVTTVMSFALMSLQLTSARREASVCVLCLSYNIAVKVSPQLSTWVDVLHCVKPFTHSKQNCQLSCLQVRERFIGQEQCTHHTRLLCKEGAEP